MIDQRLTTTSNNWREKISELESLLDEIRPQLIEAETKMADRLAVISSFEFKLRARLEPLTQRLEKLGAEIHKFRKQLHQLQENFAIANNVSDDWEAHEAWDFDTETAAASGDYRYHEAPTETPPPSFSEEETITLKQLYRQLARRFHPDLALNDADRAYRTGIMKAINAAYSTGDLLQLQELAQEPDSADRIEFAHTDQQMAQALFIELGRCRRRLVEIKEELARLKQHKSARLRRQSKRAAAKGRDLLAEIAADLQDKIAHRMIERDVLKQQIEQVEQEKSIVENDGLENDMLANDTLANELLGGDAFADAILDLGLEGVFDDEPLTAPDTWKRRSWHDDDILDDSD